MNASGCNLMIRHGLPVSVDYPVCPQWLGAGRPALSPDIVAGDEWRGIIERVQKNGLQLSVPIRRSLVSSRILRAEGLIPYAQVMKDSTTT